MRRNLLILLGFVFGLATAAGLVLLLRASDGDVLSQAETGRARWINVTYPTRVEVQSDGAKLEFLVFGLARDLENMQTFVVGADHPGNPGLRVDGMSGTILGEYYDPADPVQANIVAAIRDGLQVQPFDPASAPWPYRDEPSAGIAGEPDPLSGIQEQTIVSARTGALYENWRSRLIIWADSPPGQLDYTCEVDGADREAFARLLNAHASEGTALNSVNSPPDVASCYLQD